jgi:hypothetical protein
MVELFLSPHPVLLPEGEGMHDIGFSCLLVLAHLQRPGNSRTCRFGMKNKWDSSEIGYQQIGCGFEPLRTSLRHSSNRNPSGATEESVSCTIQSNVVPLRASFQFRNRLVAVVTQRHPVMPAKQSGQSLSSMSQRISGLRVSCPRWHRTGARRGEPRTGESNW